MGRDFRRVAQIGDVGGGRDGDGDFRCGFGDGFGQGDRGVGGLRLRRDGGSLARMAANRAPAPLSWACAGLLIRTAVPRHKARAAARIVEFLLTD